MGQVLKVFLAALGGATVGVGGALLWQTGSVHLRPLDMSYSDLAATLLGATAVLLAVLGFFIAVAALLGWTQFRDLTKRAAADAARSHLNDSMGVDGDLRSHLEKMAADFLDARFNSKPFQKLVYDRIDLFRSGANYRGLDDESNENLSDENDE